MDGVGHRIVAIIQARMGSSRLPRKVLMDIEGQTMLARTVTRARRATLLSAVVIATTDRPEDDPVVEEARKLDVLWFRGSEEDVLDRYYQAAMQFDAQVVVRITSDCPLIDPGVVDRVVGAFLTAAPSVDYASNTLERTFPRGLDTEAFRLAALERAWREGTQPYHREHVTPYLYEHPEQFRLLNVSSGMNCGDLRWTVDAQEDLELVRAVYHELGPEGRFDWQDVLRLLRSRPELAAVNRRIVQKPVRPLS